MLCDWPDAIAYYVAKIMSDNKSERDETYIYILAQSHAFELVSRDRQIKN